jgi:hypothetical protein
MDESDAGGGAADGERSAGDAFATVGNEHRVAILRALLEATRRSDVATPTSFSTLRSLSGIEVSAQFSYHLDELVGRFVRRTDDGYEFRYAGWKVATALVAGTYTDSGEFGPTAVDGACPHCDARALEAAYSQEWLSVTCTACDRRLTRYPFPPGATADRSVEAVLSAYDRRVRSHVALAGDGVCPECAGPTTGRLLSDGRARFECDRCGNRLTCAAGAVLLSDPETMAFYRANAPAVPPFWELPFAVDADAVAVETGREEGDPPERATVTVAADDETLAVVLDGEVSVVDRRRDE